MNDNQADTKDTIILSENTQREMISFFLSTSMKKLEEQGNTQQTSPEKKSKKAKE